ncbi:MAG: GntR family transcriptional regulator [Bryobacteraceae bacterium]
MHTSLAERAYLSIRERILRGLLPLGEPLSRRLLAAELGMSVIPVSEALQRLEGDRLVEIRPRAGTRVRIPSERDVREIYEVREALESHAARLFAQRATRAQKQDLRTRAEQVDVLFHQLAAGETDAEFQFLVHRSHKEFHMFVAACTGCEMLSGLIEKNQVLILNWLFDVAAHRRALPPRFHRELAELLARGDALAADEAMRAHIKYGLEETVVKMQTQAPLEWRLSRVAAAAVVEGG